MATWRGFPQARASGYRIVQEALTNAVRHSRASLVVVEVNVDTDLNLRVSDNGVGGTPEVGRGLTGMLERVELHGGTLRFGEGSEGGFEIEARIPVIRVALVDDDGLIREGLRLIIEQESDLEIVGQAENERDAVAMVSRSRPDVVLMDIRMPVMDGLDATSAITASAEPARVIILTTFELDEYVFEAIRAGGKRVLAETNPATASARGDSGGRRR
ncbi:MAG: response regulator [Acidimicrobiia bacterium]